MDRVGGHTGGVFGLGAGMDATLGIKKSVLGMESKEQLREHMSWQVFYNDLVLHSPGEMNGWE